MRYEYAFKSLVRKDGGSKVLTIPGYITKEGAYAVGDKLDVFVRKNKRGGKSGGSNNI